MPRDKPVDDRSPTKKDLATLFAWACKYPGDALVALILCIISGVLIQSAFISLLPYIMEYPERASAVFVAVGVMSWLLWRRIVYSFKFARAYFHAVRVTIWLNAHGNDPGEMLENLEPTMIKEHRKVPSLHERKASASAGIGVAPAPAPCMAKESPAASKKKNGTIRKRK